MRNSPCKSIVRHDRNCRVTLYEFCGNYFGNNTYKINCIARLRVCLASLIYLSFVPATTTTTTSRPSPPWLITSQPPMWSTIKPPSARPPHLAPPSKASISPPEPVPVPATTTVRTSSTTSHFIPKVPTEIFPPQHGDSAEEPPDEITTLPFTTVTPRNGDPVKVTTCK